MRISCQILTLKILKFTWTFRLEKKAKKITQKEELYMSSLKIEFQRLLKISEVSVLERKAKISTTKEISSIE
jgi:hypothetical protein